jgi:hypothetical protein
MDPDAALAEIRELVRAASEQRSPALSAEHRRLAELVFRLDGWLSRGGFLPTEWQLP